MIHPNTEIIYNILLRIRRNDKSCTSSWYNRHAVIWETQARGLCAIHMSISKHLSYINISLIVPHLYAPILTRSGNQSAILTECASDGNIFLPLSCLRLHNMLVLCSAHCPKSNRAVNWSVLSQPRISKWGFSFKWAKWISTNWVHLFERGRGLRQLNFKFCHKRAK